ncbi:MAG: hypothetical protein LBR10_07275 [Prevotellaceae bacterium]|jgi:hypothetical protein|nr:hypothetical protein [Prevotellaceae bacterium]
MKAFLKLRNVATIVACLAATTMSSGCDKEPESSPGAPAFAEFSFANQRGASDIDAKKRTVKAVAECGTNIASLAPAFKLSPDGTTATVDGKPQESGKTAHNFTDAVVYTLTTPDGETAEWTVTVTLPDDCPTVKKYITYNKPVTAYFIEYNGGAIAANQKNSAGNNGTVLEAYENKKYSHVWWDYSGGFFRCDLTHSNGDPCSSWEAYGSNEWMLDRLNNNEIWASDGYLESEYPLDEFAFWVSKRKLGGGFLFYNTGGLNDLADIARHPNEAEMPNNTDVTQFYLRSEKVCNIMCDVYQILNDGYFTFWVDPTTGFTLKLEVKDAQGNIAELRSYEVTRLVVGTPDWDGEHLHPRSTDTVKEP